MKLECKVDMNQFKGDYIDAANKIDVESTKGDINEHPISIDSNAKSVTITINGN